MSNTKRRKKDETLVSKRSVLEAKRMDPIALTQSLGYKTFRKSCRVTWDRDQDESLKSAVLEQFLARSKQTVYTNESIPLDWINWDTIAKEFEGRKPFDCRRRWTTSVDPSLKKGSWTAEEDEMLIEAFKEFGTSWTNVAKRLEGRSAGQCSKRYNDVLNPKAKERLKPWDTQQDIELVRKVKNYGTRWTVIAAEFEGRSGLSCRNRWRSIVTRLAKNRAPEEIKKEVGNMDLSAEIGASAETQDSVDEVSSSETQVQSSTRASQAEKVGPEKRDDTQRLRQLLERTLSPVIQKSRNEAAFSPPLTSRLSHSRVEYTYTLSKPNGQEVSNFRGPPNTGDFAQNLIDLAKANGLSITIHQEIYHHYVPSNQPIVEPEARAERYDHFNFLRPLAEVPKLTSSPSPDARVYDSGDSELIRSLNSKHGAPSGRRSAILSPPPLSLSQGPSMNPVKPTLGNRVTTPSHLANNGFISEELDQDLEMWESVQSINKTTARPSNGNGNPVSQHHPLHYQLPSMNTVYNNAGSGNQSNPVTTSSLSFGGGYTQDADQDHEEEEMESYANNYGLFYSVFAMEKSEPNVAPKPVYSGNYNPLLNEEEHSGDDDSNPSYDDNAWGDVPFNPS
ncbi:unnamed protein product [Kuraishia capsulata CBS 1993]|uniref:Uncharacterized protein n=1 Tax=Kuraishia capsulata CBS 1993 TaxID=1382522 RepID=W6MVH7_9ASCO|nr:uncharacterized protein KUCA_T00005956001 [Kuraishia capsulata CBS 1993]CDK29962.1 unnamed protein product [Kuraishia capsulata CBS 1993]